MCGRRVAGSWKASSAGEETRTTSTGGRDNLTAVSTRFEQAMRLMRRRDPQQQEEGFALLRAHAAVHLDELIAEFGKESDHGLRCWLLELIGYARSARALPVLTEQLRSPDEALRGWAVAGLQLLNSPEARQALYQDRAGGRIG